ncbi:MAG: hypothetical protein V3V08_07635 [Nannocystaceae bacterium]
MSARTLGILVSAASEAAANDAGTQGHPADVQSGADLAQALEDLGHRARLVPIDEALDLAVPALNIDACIVALHGPLGGSGRVQARIAEARLPHCGPTSQQVETAYDKWRSREILRYHNLPVPPSIRVTSGAVLADRSFEGLRWPCVLKPRRASFGEGQIRIDTASELEVALRHRSHPAPSRDLILERHIEGAEIQVVLLDGRVVGSMQVDGDQMMTPPQLGDTRISGLHNLALRAALALSLHRGICRVDVLVHPRDNEFILEVEPVPPLHRESVVARVARAAGISYAGLVQHLLGAGAQRPQPAPSPSLSPAMAV